MNLYTARLYCRPVELRDAAALFAIYEDPRTSALSPLKPMTHIDEMVSKLELWCNHWQEYGFGPWTIIDLQSGRVIGLGGLSMRAFDAETFPNLWYRFTPASWGQGLATEFASACVDWFSHAHPHKEMHALVQEHNLASRRVLEKLGFHLVGDIGVPEPANEVFAVSHHFIGPRHTALEQTHRIAYNAGLRIRGLLEEDFARIAEIQAACYGTQLQEELDSLRAKWQASAGACLVGEYAAHVDGYLFAIPTKRELLPSWNAQVCHPPANADGLYLHDMAVSPAARGKGISQALVQALVAIAFDAGHGFIQLVAVQNSAAFWQKVGFAEVLVNDEVRGQLKSYGADAVLMRRELI